MKKKTETKKTYLDVLAEQENKRKRTKNYIRHDFPEERPIVVPYCDLHKGSPHHNKDLLYENLQWSWENKDSYIVLVGDLIEAATRTSIGAGVYEQKKNAGEQLEEIIEMFTPFAKEGRILGTTNGNHEDRVSYLAGFDVMKVFADTLEIPYFKNGGFFRFRVGKYNYHAYFTHSKSGALLPYTKIKNPLKIGTYTRADIIGVAHVHDLQHLTQEYFYIDNVSDSMKTGESHYLICGHYLNWIDSYAQQAGMVPSKQGTPKIKLHSDKKTIRVTL